jgi:hypothetical protein
MTTYGAEHVRLRLDTMREDARERVGREIARLLSTAGNNGALGTRLESATTAFYCAAVNAAARVLLNVRGDCDTLDAIAAGLAADILAELEGRRGMTRVWIDDAVFDALTRRTREAMANARRVAVAEFRHGLVDGRPWPP